MSFLQIFHNFSKNVLGIGVVDAWKLADATKLQAQKARTLAESKNLRQAVLISQKAISAWSKQPGFWERLLRSYILGDTLEKINQDLQKWQAQVTQASELLNGAKSLLQQDNNNPHETKILLDALELCKRAGKILHDEQISQTISNCQTELKQREDFRKLVQEADTQAERRFFEGAINIYNQAEQLYPTLSVKQSIAACETQVKQEKIYYTAFTKANIASNEGRLRSAIALLEAALNKFPRQDGIALLEKLQRTVKGKEKYRLGLQAEKAGNFTEATTLYKSAAVLLPNSTDCKIRLGIVAIKTEEWSIAISQLTDIETEQSRYLRGFAYAKQGQLQTAHREWQNLQQTNKLVRQQENIKVISQRQKLLSLKQIEEFIVNDNLEQAQTSSQEHLQKFGSDSLVEVNLNEHILPRIKSKVWQNKHWHTLADTTIKLWESSPNIINLHNWLIATYYQVFSDASTGVIEDLIIALPTALANLNQDLTLHDIPWLENQKVDLELISLELQRRLEETIDKFQANQLEQYLKFRDKYRLEKVALRLMGNPVQIGMKVKKLFITPGCYSRFFNKWQNFLVTDIHPSERILQTLYTPWGLSVAACLESDVARAIQIKPLKANNNNIELFALAFVAYHEGCHYLQQQQWQKAATYLNQAKTEIKAFPDWIQEIDRLCLLQRQVISEFEEHLKFAQFWYDLIGSKLAKSYLAEYKAEELREKLVNQQISQKEALKQIQKISIIDDKNPVVLDLIERLEFAQEFEQFNNLMKRGLYDQAVKKAKKSRNERVRFAVAEIFIQIIINAAEKGDASDYEMVQQLGRWAYEICPDAPEFREIYRSLRICY
ncbi:peptidase M, neutral zinc metallopeptidase site [Calothrix sp. HK-06]|nr:peptidase M, neutral zinc metallopeptidase site [Calothrix sp. HK-06]